MLEVKIRVQAESSETPVFGLKTSSQGKRGMEAFLNLFYKGIISFMRMEPSWPSHFSKAPPPDIIT